MSSKLLHHPVVHLAIILMLGGLVYANSFGVPFVLDDLESIARNETIHNLANYLPGGSGYETLFRRWVGYFTFALNYHFGGLNVVGYHLFNLVVHLSAALLVYFLLRLTFRTPFLVDSRLAPQAALTALLAALLFVAHPVQTQAVTYTVQRLTSLCTLFYLLSLVLYVSASLSAEAHGQVNGKGSSAPRWRFPLLLGGSVVSAVLAMFTKEIAFTLPLAALLYEACFFRSAWQRRARLLVPLLLTLVIVPLLVVTDEELPTSGGLPQTRTEISRLDYFLTQFRVMVTYLRLLFLPINQNLDYDYPLYSTFFTPPVFLSFLLLVAIFVLAVYLFLRTSPRTPVVLHLRSRPLPASSAPSGGPNSGHGVPLAAEMRLVAFGIIWFFLTLAVESSFIPIADVIFEHRLYLPLVGAAVAVATLIALAREKTVALYGGNIPLLLAVVAISVLAVATWQRNQVWQSEASLWADVTRKSPGKQRPWYNLGTHLMTNSGKPEEAIPALLRAVALDPQHAESWHNLGSSYLMSNRPEQAVPPLRTAVRLAPNMANAVVNLAVALIHTRHPEEAIRLLEGVRLRLPNWPEVRLNLGIAYVGSGNLDAARRELAALQQLAPHLTPALFEQIKFASAKAPASNN